MTAESSTQASGEPRSILTPADELRLFRVLGAMPYSAGIRTVREPRHLTVDELHATLVRLADCLTEHVKECTARDAQLEHHRDLIRGGRKLLAALLPEA